MPDNSQDAKPCRGFDGADLVPCPVGFLLLDPLEVARATPICEINGTFSQKVISIVQLLL